MLLEQGEKVHVIERRLFEEDIRRHFVGEVQACVSPCFRATGFAFVYNSTRNVFERRQGVVERVISMADSRTLIHVLDEDVDLQQVRYEIKGNRLVVTDGDLFEIDINEFGPRT